MAYRNLKIAHITETLAQTVGAVGNIAAWAINKVWTVESLNLILRSACSEVAIVIYPTLSIISFEHILSRCVTRTYAERETVCIVTASLCGLARVLGAFGCLFPDISVQFCSSIVNDYLLATLGMNS